MPNNQVERFKNMIVAALTFEEDCEICGKATPTLELIEIHIDFEECKMCVACHGSLFISPGGRNLEFLVPRT